MKNEKGVTLVELIATLAILGMIVTLIVVILINSLKTTERNKVNQHLQQESNYITEVVRKEYLKRPDDKEVEKTTIDLKVAEEKLFMDNQIISEGYTYILDTTSLNREERIEKFEIELQKDNLAYKVNTTFSKLK